MVWTEGYYLHLVKQVFTNSFSTYGYAPSCISAPEGHRWHPNLCNWAWLEEGAVYRYMGNNGEAPYGWAQFGSCYHQKLPELGSK